MVHLHFDSTATVFLTLGENVTLTSPKYLFVFTRRIAGSSFAAVLTPTESNERYERFDIDVSTLFAGKDPGQWQYEVFEQESDDNLDPEQATGSLEKGIAIVHAAAAFTYQSYEHSIEFIQPQ